MSGVTFLLNADAASVAAVEVGVTVVLSEGKLLLRLSSSYSCSPPLYLSKESYFNIQSVEKGSEHRR